MARQEGDADEGDALWQDDSSDDSHRVRQGLGSSVNALGSRSLQHLSSCPLLDMQQRQLQGGTSGMFSCMLAIHSEATWHCTGHPAEWAAEHGTL